MSLRNLLGAVALTVLCLAQSAFAAPDSVNVNTADAETLAAVLDGVGLTRAQAIVQYRESNGSFGDVYDLANVKGIGDRTIELNAERIRLAD
ncbi:MAG: ComEA family DNA-binding protein [Pseudomonadales bacterium]|jgi:competence protein ComEA